MENYPPVDFLRLAGHPVYREYQRPRTLLQEFPLKSRYRIKARRIIVNLEQSGAYWRALNERKTRMPPSIPLIPLSLSSLPFLLFLSFFFNLHPLETWFPFDRFENRLQSVANTHWNSFTLICGPWKSHTSRVQRVHARLRFALKACCAQEDKVLAGSTRPSV